MAVTGVLKQGLDGYEGADGGMHDPDADADVGTEAEVNNPDVDIDTGDESSGPLPPALILAARCPLARSVDGTWCGAGNGPTPWVRSIAVWRAPRCPETSDVCDTGADDPSACPE